MTHHKKINPEKILILGSGVAGVKCALTLSDLGYSVFLADKTPYLGGKISKLYKQFPTNDCGWCKMLPQFWRGNCLETCLRRNISHKNLHILPYTQVKSVAGESGKFEVKLHAKTRYIYESKCIGCGLCVLECPVEVADEYNEKTTKRKAIWMRNGGPVPRVVTVDIEHCTKCGKCVEICPTKAVDLNLKDAEESMEFNAIVLATGYEEAMPELSEYGYGRFPNVLTNMELERALSGDGPRTIDLANRDIGIIQCVGSRTEANDYCSYACCMYALKEAMMLKESFPTANITIYYMDMRTFGKDYYRYQQEAEKMGIRFIQCRVPAVDTGTEGKVVIKWTDEEKINSVELDYVVLSIGQKIAEETKKLVQALGLKHDKYGFVEISTAKPVETSKPGIYACGSASGPKDIPDSVTEAMAVAAEISLAHPVTAKPEEKVKFTEEIEPRIALFLCACGLSPGKVHVSPVFDSIIERAKKAKGVVVAEKSELLCQNPEKVIDVLKEHKVTRLLVAACAPYQYQEMFERTASEAGIDPQMVEIADIREQALWVHRDAAKTVERQVALALAKLYNRDRVEETKLDVFQQALVIGGGIGGLTAALLLARHGIKVDLVEKEKEAGGLLHQIHKTIDGTDMHNVLSATAQRTTEEQNIKIMAESEVTSVLGHCGGFTAIIRSKESSNTGKYGAMLLATGGNEYKGKDFGYGTDKRIMTQNEFETVLESGHAPKKVVMIQCVGSRDKEHPYCSRVCCSVAIKNALALKKKSPDAEIYIMHRDIMTYGLLEKYYTDARKAGVNFVRFVADEKPQVEAGESIRVRVKDKIMGRELEITPDAVVLSAGIVPNPIKQIVDGIKVEINDDGFVKEANIKFRPVDTLRDGVFVCGLAHSPRSIGETIVQAQAAGIQMLNLLKGGGGARHVVSEVSERWCIACEMCVTACPYGARVMDTEKNIAKVIEPLCRGCGACAVVCPSESSKLVGYKRKGMMDVIDVILEV